MNTPTDTERLDWLERNRRYYSKPPMRAVTGWQWGIVDESGIPTAREAIDAAIHREREVAATAKK